MSGLSPHSLKQKIDAAIKRADGAPVFKHPKIEKTNLAIQVMIEFCVPIAAGAVFGVWLDKQFSSSPILLIIFVLLGFATAIMSVLRLTKQPDKDVEISSETDKTKD